MTNEICDRCADKLEDIPDLDFHNACHDYMEDYRPDPNDCAECARSFGPHYTGECDHE